MVTLEHIGIAVRDAEHTVRVIRDVLGKDPYKSETVKHDSVRTHFIDGGGAKLELLESLEPDSPLARFVNKHGEGLHHLAFEVADVRGAMERLRSRGYDPIDEEPRTGADGKDIFFLHPKQTAGFLIEICQTSRGVLRPGKTADGGLEIREAGGDERPCVVYVHRGDVMVDPEALARSLERRFAIRAMQATRTIGADELSTALGGVRTHVVASSSLVQPALEAAAATDSIIDSLVLIDPRPQIFAHSIDQPVLIIAADGKVDIDHALRLRTAIPGSTLAVLPWPDLFVEVIEAFLGSGASDQSQAAGNEPSSSNK